MALNTRHYTDIDLNFMAHPVTGDINILTDEDAINQSVQDLIFTDHYDYGFHPEVGSSVTNLLFENATTLTNANVQRAIVEVLANFEPRCTVQTVDVTTLPNQHALAVTIIYYINNSVLPITLNMILELLR